MYIFLCIFKRFKCNNTSKTINTYMEKIIIVGGVAAATAAAKVRRLSSDASITMFEAGPDISFANCRPPLLYRWWHKKSFENDSPKPWKLQWTISSGCTCEHTRIANIDRQNKTVTSLNVRTGEIRNHKYDKLLLAQGGRPIKPRIEGADLDHVYTLWTLNDMDNIQRHIEEKSPKNAVVIGGGFIGLEMVEALVKKGVECASGWNDASRVMSVMDAETAGYIEQNAFVWSKYSYGKECDRD